MPVRLLAKTYHRFGAQLSAEDLGRLDALFAKLQANPASPGLGFERVASAIDPGMWIVRLGSQLCAAVHVDGDRFTLLRAGLPDTVITWARSTRVRVHPVTGRVQIVEMPGPLGPGDLSDSGTESDLLDFSRYGEGFLVSLGVPEEWVPRVRHIRSEAGFWEVHRQMPEEVAELLYSLALGETVTAPRPIDAKEVGSDADTLRRMYVLTADDDLATLLSRPFEEWMLYLHPSQRSVVEAEFAGPSKITGSAGTGKTVVAIHRARWLARQGYRVLLTTYTNKLAKSLYTKVCALCEEPTPGSAITVLTTHKTAMELLSQAGKKVKWADADDVETLLKKHKKLAPGFEKDFVAEEWDEVIAHHGIREWPEYRDIARTGRGSGLQQQQRETLWKLFEAVLADLNRRSSWPWGHICRMAREVLESGAMKAPFDAVIVDEVQDLSTQEVRLLAALCGKGPSHLMIIGDAGQRIYPGGFSLRSLGLETRGRSRRLQINYRTTLEIERAAARLRDIAADDLDGDAETPLATQSLLRGPKPVLRGFAAFEEEDEFVAQTIRELLVSGVKPREIAVFGRTWRHLYQVREAIRRRGIPVAKLRDDAASDEEVIVSTMHGAKGLEFRYVFIVACRKSVVPARFALKGASDATELEVATKRERNLLYVSMTRARDKVWITWTGEPSEFVAALEPMAEVNGSGAAVPTRV